MLIIGLMSGTSADGIDAALCEVTGQPPALQARIIHTAFEAFADDFHERIRRACHPQTSHVDEICQLHVDLADRFAEAVLRVIREAGYTPADIDLVGLHGQTVWHSIDSQGRATATLQITEASALAHKTGITIISNFRPRDIAAGGQGAPLTSYVDWLLLRHPSHWRAIQNIGGVSNVTFLPPLSDEGSSPLAFDTGPGNLLMDGAIYALSGGQHRYDTHGEMAERGQIDEAWLDDLLTHPYYERRPPKTTGRELYSQDMIAALVESGRKRGLNDNSILATLTALTAASIADAYQRYAPGPIAEVIVGGGGNHNRALMRMLANFLPPSTHLLTHEDIGLDSDYKEALVFAVLAHETWHARPGNHPALTGARQSVVLGQITPGNNYADLIRRTWGQAIP
jgi:anhydro-N-acetylmuramic acid kinase